MQFLQTGWARAALLLGLGCAVLLPQAQAQSVEDYEGYWLDEKKSGIVRLYRCKSSSLARTATALCGRIVWDVEQSNPNRKTPLDCNRRVVYLADFQEGSWSNGWVFDPRSQKSWKARLIMSGDRQRITARLYAGNETQNHEEIFTRVANVPPGCEGKKPERIVL